MTIKQIKDLASIVQSSVTVIAIIFAGIWFIEKRESSLKANISHLVTHRKISDDWTWVHLEVTILNDGSRLLNIQKGIIWVQQILPIDQQLTEKLRRGEYPIPKDGTQVIWPRIGDPYTLSFDTWIEPGESDTLYYDFIIPSSARKIRIYSFFNKEASKIGWSMATIYNIENNGD